jgi:hypothetical protein
MQARLPPVSGVLGGEPIACGRKEDNQDLCVSPIAYTIRRTPTVFERVSSMSILSLRFCVLAVSIFPLTASAEIRKPTYDAQSVKAECTQKWANQFDMIKYCMDEREKGFSYFKQVTEIVGDFFSPTLNHCADKWGHQWDMTAYCAETNLNAMKTSKEKTAGLPKNTADLIMARCFQKWNPQWDMIAYCAEEQATAWKAINN